MTILICDICGYEIELQTYYNDYRRRKFYKIKKEYKTIDVCAECYLIKKERVKLWD